MQFLKQAEINQRYFTNFHLEKVLQQLDASIFKISILGKSVQQKNIYRVDFGTGDFKILLWSQMHGNETTTTRAIVDFLHYVNEGKNTHWLEKFSFTFIPVLNPDGAEAFTRVNANAVDLNRDSVNLSQPESQLLRAVFNETQPNLALNMHDQRTIFSAGNTSNAATLSFLAPAYNEERSINNTRKFAMQLIAAMHQSLKKSVPGHIGRFDDGFNINCIGDLFTHLNTPTILFEAGFYPNDYQRLVAKKLVFDSLIILLNSLLSEDYKNLSITHYMEIPENQKNFVDLLIENFATENPDYATFSKLPIVFKEHILNGELLLKPEVDFESAPAYQFSHNIVNVAKKVVNSSKDLENALKNVMIS
ncbi:DUF2817 domain-containing protein [Flavobacterium sp. CBA20B-1]|uniref:M14 family zinc carboxypeptidase n=1 Tax=unclassified Flavobacterium TaxID=196869 RepID=UPI002224006B|nr:MULTISPECIES: M14 family zinc carboxypeptidase [unclassified Flavobacterium]WCM42297.1 DUF2817 domain-containing protein [Flavobacterium sp. CBA20B-1]